MTRSFFTLWSLTFLSYCTTATVALENDSSPFSMLRLHRRTPKQSSMAGNEFWTMPQMMRPQTELETKRALLEGYSLFDLALSMSMSMDGSIDGSGSADGPNAGAGGDDDYFMGNTVSPTAAPTLGSTTTTVSDGDTVEDATTTTPGGTDGDTIPTLAPNPETETTDPDGSTTPDDSLGPTTTASSNRGGAGLGLAWIGIAAVVAAIVGGAFWWTRHGGGGGGFRGIGGVVAAGGVGDSSDSSMSSTSRLVEV